MFLLSSLQERSYTWSIKTDMQGSAPKMSGTRIILWASESVHQVTAGQLQSQKYYCKPLASCLEPDILKVYFRCDLTLIIFSVIIH